MFVELYMNENINCFTILPPFDRQGDLYCCRIGGSNNPTLQVTWNHDVPIDVSLNPKDISLAKEKRTDWEYQNQLNVQLAGIVHAGNAALCELIFSVNTSLFAWVSRKVLKELKLTEGAPAVALFNATAIRRIRDERY
jgi:ABC-type molybdate transport system ATPase subunit